MSIGETVEKNLLVELSEHEVYSYGLEQAKLLNEVSGLEEERSEINRRIKPRKERISYLSPIIENGKEVRAIKCVWEKYNNQEKVLIRTDTGEFVDGPIKMTDEELQMSMFDE